jgi:periplasmic mercuric ion binding protein
MKNSKIFYALILALGIIFSTSVAAQDKGKAASGPKTESIKVWGACGMCKDRIEKTVKAEGATSASWDSKTQLLAVTYDVSKTNTDALSKKLASVGHDTEKYKAPDDVYAKLPGCCHYERSK